MYFFSLIVFIISDWFLFRSSVSLLKSSLSLSILSSSDKYPEEPLNLVIVVFLFSFSFIQMFFLLKTLSNQIPFCIETSLFSLSPFAHMWTSEQSLPWPLFLQLHIFQNFLSSFPASYNLKVLFIIFHFITNWQYVYCPSFLTNIKAIWRHVHSLLL